MLCIILVTCLLASFPLVSSAQPPQVGYWTISNFKKYNISQDPEALFNRVNEPITPRDSTQSRTKFIPLFPQQTSGQWSQGFSDTQHYSFKYWENVDVAVYFGGSASEGQILAPPPYWIRPAHRNGVKILGCIFFPPDAYGGQAQWVDDFLNLDVARNLIEVANYLGFDGWFINQETFAANVPQVGQRMQQLMSYIQTHSSLTMIWYDSMVMSGEIAYQNTLNDLNSPFFQAGTNRISDGIFTNFWWQDVTSARDKAISLGRQPADVYSGIDCSTTGCQREQYDRIAETTSMGTYLTNFTFSEKAPPEQNDFDEEKFFKGWAAAGWPGITSYTGIRTLKVQTPWISTFNIGRGKKFALNGEQIPWRSRANGWTDGNQIDFLPNVRVKSPISFYYDYDVVYEGGTSLRFEGDLQEHSLETIPLYQFEMDLNQSRTTFEATLYLPQSSSAVDLTWILNTDGAGQLRFPVETSRISHGVGSSAWITFQWDLPKTSGILRSISLEFQPKETAKSIHLYLGRLAVVPTFNTPPVPHDLKFALDQSQPIVTWDARQGSMYHLFGRLLASNALVFLGRSYGDRYYIESPLTDFSELILEERSPSGLDTGYAHLIPAHRHPKWLENLFRKLKNSASKPTSANKS